MLVILLLLASFFPVHLCPLPLPPVCVCVCDSFVYFQEQGAQVTFSRRKQCDGIPGNFLPLVSLNTEVYISQNQSGFCFSFCCSRSLLWLQYGF